MQFCNLPQNIKDELKRKIDTWIESMCIAKDAAGHEYDELEYAYDDGWESIVGFVESTVNKAFYYGVDTGLNIQRKIINNE